MTAVNPGTVARTVGIDVNFKDLRAPGALLLGMKIAVIGQGADTVSYSTVKRRVLSAQEVGETYGFGSPLHLAVLQLLPSNGDGVGTIPVTVYPLPASTTESGGTILVSGVPTKDGTFILKFGGIATGSVTIKAGTATAAIAIQLSNAINATLNIPVVAAAVSSNTNFIGKWKGTTSDMSLELIGPTDTGTTYALTAPTAGVGVPDIQPALDQFGSTWETLVINCLAATDTTTLDLVAAFNETRWEPEVRMPFVSFTGTREADVATAIAVPNARKTDRTNSQLVSPGSNDLEFIISARQVARIAVIANNNPPVDYGSQQATGLTPGADGDQWTGVEREAAVLGGSSTVQVKDGVVNLSDTIVYYKPDGETPPAFRFVVDQMRIFNVLFATGEIFDSIRWDGKVLIPDNQPTTNPEARKPKDAKADIYAMLDSLGLNAIISDPEAAKLTVVSVINGTNPKRLDNSFTIQLSGNANVISIDLDFGFFFGTAPIIG